MFCLEPAPEPPSQPDQDSDLMLAIQLSLEGEGRPTSPSQSSQARDITPMHVRDPLDNESSFAFENNQTTKNDSKNNE